jgi:hypothetical protein
MQTSLSVSLLALAVFCLLSSGCQKEKKTGPTGRVIGPFDTLFSVQFEPLIPSPWDYGYETGLWKKSPNFNLPHRAIEQRMKVFIAPDTSSTWQEVHRFGAERFDLGYQIFMGRLQIEVFQTQFYLMDFDKEIVIKINYMKVQDY